MNREHLTVLSWAGGWGRALREAVSDPFERETGVRVEHTRHVGLKLPGELYAALADGRRPPVDLVWSNSVPALQAARRGECLPLERSEMPVLDELRRRAWPGPRGDDAPVRRGHDSALVTTENEDECTTRKPAELRSAHRSWGLRNSAAIGELTTPGRSSTFVVHPYVVYYVLTFHEAAFPDGPPTSWRVLEEPRHRGKIALYPGGNGFYPIAQRLGGGRVEDIPHDMTACWSYLSQLGPQIRELDYSIGMEERLRRRELDLCFRALTNALAFREAGVPVGWTVPKEGTTDTVDAMWIPRGVPEPNATLAKRYIAFALRPDVQAAWCELLGAMPVHPAAKAPTPLRGRVDLPENADDDRGILLLDEDLKVRLQDEWEKRFDDVVRTTPLREISR